MLENDSLIAHSALIAELQGAWQYWSDLKTMEFQAISLLGEHMQFCHSCKKILVPPDDMNIGSQILAFGSSIFYWVDKKGNLLHLLNTTGLLRKCLFVSAIPMQFTSISAIPILFFQGTKQVLAMIAITSRDVRHPSLRWCHIIQRVLQSLCRNVKHRFRVEEPIL
ncbi:hypothetical protein Pelo_18353 [Pelomyxa schiedti]|nr:hypothetical protein Pelo_18353 [Pelomyxa schiedti]